MLLIKCSNKIPQVFNNLSKKPQCKLRVKFEVQQSEEDGTEDIILRTMNKLFKTLFKITF